MVDTTTKIVLDSAHPQGDAYRLTTFLLRYPKFVHAEDMRHRMGSACVSSSRAIPVSKNLEEVRSDELRAGPIWWGAEQRGMTAATELDDVELVVVWPIALPTSLRLVADYLGFNIGERITEREYAKRLWKIGSLFDADVAEEMTVHRVHKSIANRKIEDSLHVNVLRTFVARPGLMNFFGLRLDRAAQPEIRAVAEAMWAAWNESEPKLLQPGEWHLPFIEAEDQTALLNRHHATGDEVAYFDELRRISTAYCARLTHRSFETGKRSTIDENLALYDRLIASRPIHASPAEHQGTPDQWVESWKDNYGNGWARPELHGNLPGWIQYRKTLPGEAQADIPEGYERRT